MGARVTIKELAHRTGVSVASVSRALNGLPGVSQETRRLIEDAARELGYAPDSRAQALVTGRVPFVGLVVPDISNPFYPELARGAEEALLVHGHSLLLVSTDWEAPRLERALALLQSRHVAGLLVSVPLNGVLKRPDWPSLEPAMVAVGQEPPRGAGNKLQVVDVDDRHGGYLVGQHLAALSRKRLAFIAGPEDRTAGARLAGFRLGLQGNSAARLTEVLHGDWTVQWGRSAAGQLLHNARPPDAVFAANDLIALGVAQVAAELGLRLGRDLALVGYDDIEPLRFLDVPITSVAQPKRELGRRAAQLLLGTLAGAKRRKTKLRLKPELVIRQSCGGRS